jgi:uncharacterized protein
MPTPMTPPAPRDLSDAEFAELDELLTQTPAPLRSVDVVMLDGFLCGVLAQPVHLEPEDWLPFVFDFDAQPLPQTVDAQWHQKTLALVQRRYAALDYAVTKQGSFDPLILEDDDGAPSPPAEDGSAGEVPSDDDPSEAFDLSALSEISQVLMPWVAGFQFAMLSFPQLEDLQQAAVGMGLMRLFRHLPADSAEEQEALALIEREYPLESLEEAVQDLVGSVVDLIEIGRTVRYRVETVQRTGPKLGRNDPCFCGSGKKLKQCHGSNGTLLH